MKRFIKQFIGFIVVLFLPLLISRRKGEVLILSYHRILPKSHPEYIKMQPGMVVSDETFRKHLLWLKRFMKIASLVDYQKTGLNSKQPVCVITLDDGWIDNYTYAFPILKELKVPATIFLVSNMIDTDNYFWPEKLGLLLDIDGSEELFQKHVKNLYGSELSGYQNYDQLIELLKSKSDESIIEILDSVENELVSMGKIISNRRQVLNTSELLEMFDSGLVEYGSHTANHIRLDKVSNEKVSSELLESKIKLESLLNNKISTFCYPNGSYTADVVSKVSDVYDLACTTDSGWVQINDNKYKLKRFMLHDDITNTMGLFWVRALGIF